MKIPDRDWVIHCADADIDESAMELVTALATTYAQLAAEDSLEIVSSSAADITQTVSVVTIDDEGNRVENSIALDTAAGTTAVTLPGGTHRYYDHATIDAECAGTITIRRATGSTFIDSIEIGQTRSYVAQHFNGDLVTYVDGWQVTNVAGTDDVKFQLRWYKDDADCLDPGDGFEVIDTIVITAAQMDSPRHDLGGKRKFPAGGWLCVYAIGGTADESVTVTVTGRDARR